MAHSLPILILGFKKKKKKIHEEVRVKGRKNGKMINVASVSEMRAFF